MTWVFPADQAASATREGLKVASFWAAILLVAGGTTTLVAHALLEHDAVPLIGLGGLALLTAVLVVAVRLRRPAIPVAATMILIGASGIALLGVELSADPSPSRFAAGSSLVAVTALGGIADRWTGVTGTIVAFLVAQVAMFAIAPGATPDATPAFVALTMAIYYGVMAVAGDRRSLTQRWDAAARDDIVASRRRAFEQRSRALVHDTVLSELVALGLARPGPLSPETRASILESLAAVRGPGDAESYAAAPGHALGAVLDRERRAGLEIDVTGDPGILDTLPAPSRAAMLQAIDQALVNVRKHSGVQAAELSMISSRSSVVVTVVDEGVGFVEADIPGDRFGFRESIRGGLEAVGGGARILSSPGAGTSVVLTVPEGASP